MRSGEVAERSNAAHCKSVALRASEVRILPSPPAFARFASYGWQANGRATGCRASVGRRRVSVSAGASASRAELGVSVSAGLPAGAP